MGGWVGIARAGKRPIGAGGRGERGLERENEGGGLSRMDLHVRPCYYCRTVLSLYGTWSSRRGTYPRTLEHASRSGISRKAKICRSSSSQIFSSPTDCFMAAIAVS